MSIHMMIVAAYLPDDVVTQGQKLALMKICDSADDETRLSKPGMKRVRAWVGVGEKRCTTIVTELVAKGLIERVEVGMLGRRAVYRVFPLGVPPIPSNDDLDARFLAAAAAPKNPNKARSGITRAAPSKPAMTHEDIDARTRFIRGPRARPASGSGRRRSGSRSGSSWRTGTRTKPGRGRWSRTARRTWRRPGWRPARRTGRRGKRLVTPARPQNKTGPPPE